MFYKLNMPKELFSFEMATMRKNNQQLIQRNAKENINIYNINKKILDF